MSLNSDQAKRWGASDEKQCPYNNDESG
jgi:hypothetical protein